MKKQDKAYDVVDNPNELLKSILSGELFQSFDDQIGVFNNEKDDKEKNWIFYTAQTTAVQLQNVGNRKLQPRMSFFMFRNLYPELYNLLEPAEFSSKSLKTFIYSIY